MNTPYLFLILLLSFSWIPVQADRVLLLVERGFNLEEFYQMYLPLRAMGVEVHIASGEKGVVPFRKTGELSPESWRDVLATHRLADLEDISGYDAVYIPGGYSPGFLQQRPDAVRLVRAFSEAEHAWTAAVCHGPRLLMAAGVLENRVWTGLHAIPNEMADAWVSGRHGTYVDRALVEDGNLLTARYPQDTPGLARALLAKRADEGGRSLPDGAGKFLVLAPEGFPRHLVWAMRIPLDVLGYSTFAKSEFNPAWVEEGIQGIVRVRFEDGKTPELPEDPGVPVLEVALSREPFRYPEWADDLLAFAETHEIPTVQVGDATLPDAVLALAPGFDDQVAAAMNAWMTAQGRNVAVVAPRDGWVKGHHGTVFEVEGTYDNPPPLADAAWIVAPGRFWPEKREARQSVQPDWIEQQAVDDDARRQFLLTRHQEGDTLVLIGLDALRIGRMPQFQGAKFSTTIQARWSFGREGGRFSHDAARESVDRLFSASGFASLPALWKLLEASAEP